MDANQPFQGDKKLPLKSPLAKVERRFIDYWVPRFPRWIEGYHLTLTTILWSAGLIMAGHLAKHDLRWLWFASGSYSCNGSRIHMIVPLEDIATLEFPGGVFTWTTSLISYSCAQF